jgi:hypothetical protein
VGVGAAYPLAADKSLDIKAVQMSDICVKGSARDSVVGATDNDSNHIVGYCLKA